MCKLFVFKIVIVYALFIAMTVCPIESFAQTNLEPVKMQSVKIDGFWDQQYKRLIEKWLPHCIEQMEEGGEGEELLNLIHTANALSDQPHGEFKGLPWADAYVYNTVESICLALELDSSNDQDLAQAQDYLRQTMDEWIPIILAAQSEDGYIHSYHVINDIPRYTNIHNHEFYVQGYFIEMGVAHYLATNGKDRRLYDAAIRCADHLVETFGPEPKRMWFHGHAGMGYALCRLARLVNDVEGEGQGDKYIELAKYLLDNRHKTNDPTAYNQSHLPVIKMEKAEGHAVRATYFYTAMADLAVLANDEHYQQAVDNIWDNAIHKKHYITGGVGSSSDGEAFGTDYDLRNNGYCESCAACGLTFWADRMHRHHQDAHYIDVQERSLYNAILGAMELSGENFYYQNPLASDQPRYSWHFCPCCVGNIPRALIAMKDLMFSTNQDKDVLWVNHYIDSEGTISDLAGTDVSISQNTDYPWNGKIDIVVNPNEASEFAINLRIPNRTESDIYTAVPDVNNQYTLRVNGETVKLDIEKGYVTIKRTWQAGDRIELILPMEIQRVYADKRVKANVGRVALQRGPITYNIEDIDNDNSARSLVLNSDTELRAVEHENMLDGIVLITGENIIAIPNYTRLNRGGWSQVWIIENPDEVIPDHGTAINVEPIDRPDLDSITIDKVIIADATSETNHNLKTENSNAGIFKDRAWRHATNGGWFSYELDVKAGETNKLLVTYWGSDSGNRKFRIFVNDANIANVELDNNYPDLFYDMIYNIPDVLTKDENSVTVRFDAEEGATAGGIFDLRIIQKND